MAEEAGRAAAHRLAPWPEQRAGCHEGQQASYGAADMAEGGERRKPQQDRMSAILGGIGVVALILGLAQVADMGGHRSVAVGQGSNYMPALKAVASRHAQLRTFVSLAGNKMQANMLQEVNSTASDVDANETDAVPAAEGDSVTAEGDAVTGMSPGVSECCACAVDVPDFAEAAGNDTADGSDTENEAGVEANATVSAAVDSPAAENVTAPAAPEAAEAPAEEPAAAAKTLDGGQMLQRRKLLQDVNTSVVEAPAAGANATAAPGTPADVSVSASGCCPCSDGPAEHITVVEEDWSSSAMPKDAWDSALSIFKYMGKGMWRDGYQTVHDQDGERMVPKPEEPEHKLPTIGPRDIMVPSLEFEGTEHNGGWAVTPDFFGDGQPHAPKNQDETEHEINKYIGGDRMVDQRITHMKDPANGRGHQLPGVTVDWSKIPHPADASKEGMPTKKAPHIVHRNDGSIEFETDPAGSSVPYRGDVRQMVFKPCKKHPLHGCELDPPMPNPTAAPAPVEPMVVTDTAEEATVAPKYIVDEEDRRFVKSMFDDAVDLDENNGPITHNMVDRLEVKYSNFLNVKPYNRWYLNVFDYMKEEYEMTPAAKAEIQRILRKYKYDGQSMSDYIDPTKTDTAGAAMSAQEGATDKVEEHSATPGVDISYSSSNSAVSSKQVLCKPLDFCCFFGLTS